MRTIICSKNIKKANYKLEDIIEHIQKDKIKIFQKSKSGHLVILTNEDEYEVMQASDNIRGHKCDKIYVDIDLDVAFMQLFVPSIVICSKLPKEEQIVYF